MSRRQRQQAGFTLLEAIVALTIFAICAMALYGWMAVNQAALIRVEARDRAISDGRAALAALEGVNPMREPQGERSLPGELDIRWTSTEVAPRTEGMGPSGSMLIFDLALYELDVRVLRSGREIERFTVQRVGWESVRSFNDDL